MKLWKNSRVSRTFLTGANPFVLKFSRLMEIADLIKKYFPSNKTIGCFSRVTDISLKTDEELFALAAVGFDLLTIGIETGDDEALEFMHKGYLSKDIVTQCLRLDKAGIGYNFFTLQVFPAWEKANREQKQLPGYATSYTLKLSGQVC